MFERSRGAALKEFRDTLKSFRGDPMAEKAVQRLVEIKTGRVAEFPKVVDLPALWDALPRRREPDARYAEQCRGVLRRFAEYLAVQDPLVTEFVKVSPDTARAFMDAEAARGLAPKTWNDTLKLLRTIFKRGHPQLNDGSNPFHVLITKATETVNRDPFPIPVLKAILDLSKEDPFIRPVIVTGICTAMRRGDCCLMKWDDVDLEEGYITVKTSKTGETVDVPMFPMLKDLLRAAVDKQAEDGQKSIYCFPDPEVLEAFRIANRAMGQAARQREGVRLQADPATVAAPQWRPFQLAFILMTLRSMVDPFQADRQVVDLLFFPTGGGKTEAYLGLAAFTMVLRRFRNPGIRSAGMSVLMRYTLRLLTLDQLSRAAALMCALELEREKDKKRLGDWPFEIGLWVGSAATPNRMGAQGDTGPGADRTAYRKWRQFVTNDRNPAPIPIENCPWCGEKFTKNSFRLEPTQQNPTNLTVRCVNYKCAFSRDRALPIIGVDEPIYRRLPPAMVTAQLGKISVALGVEGFNHWVGVYNTGN